MLGANINEVGKDSATIRVVSRMFNIRFDTLYQRYQREQKKHRRQLTAIIIIAFLFLSGIAGWIWYQNVLLREREWKMMKNQARAVTEKANQLIDNGEALTAVRILMQIIPDEGKQRPSLPESEVAIRRAVDSLNQSHFSSISLQEANNTTIKTMQLSKDGKLLATGDEAGEIKIWDVNGRSFTLRHTLKEHKAMVSCIRFNDYGTKMLSGSWDRSAILWDVETGKVLQVFPDKEWVFGVSFYNADNTIAITSNIVRIWSVEQNKVIDSLFFYSGEYFIHSFEISNNHKRALVAVGSSLIHYDLEGRRIIAKINSREGEFSSARWSEDESTVIAVSNPNYEWSESEHKSGLHGKIPSLYIIDANTFSVLREEKRGFNDIIQSARFCENDKSIITTTNDGDITLWDLNSSGLFSAFRNYGCAVFDAVPLLSGDFVSVNGSSLRIWTKERSLYRDCLENRQNDLHSITLSNDGSCASTNGFRETKIWALPGWELVATANLGYVLSPCSTITSNNDYFAMINSQDSVITVFDMGTGERFDLTGHHDIISSLSFSPDDNFLVSSSHDNSVILWDWKNKSIKRCMEEHKDCVHDVRFSPDGKLIASASRDQSIHLWHVFDNDMHSLNDHKGTVFCISFSPDGKYLASVDGKGFVIVWDLKTLASKWNVHLDELGLHHVEYSPDGSSLLCSTIGGFYILDAEDGSIRYICKSMELLSDAHFNKEGDRIIIPTALGNVREYPWVSMRELMNQLSDSPPLSDKEKRDFYLED